MQVNTGVMWTFKNKFGISGKDWQDRSQTVEAARREALVEGINEARDKLERRTVQEEERKRLKD